MQFRTKQNSDTKYLIRLNNVLKQPLPLFLALSLVIKTYLSQHLPLSTLILLIISSSLKLSPNLLAAVTTNSYVLPFSNLAVTKRIETSVMTFSLVHSSSVLSSLTVLLYTVYCVMDAPLFCGSFHFMVTCASFVSPGRPIISAASGTPQLKTKMHAKIIC